MKADKEKTAAKRHWPWWGTICFAAAGYAFLSDGSNWLLTQGMIESPLAVMLQKLSPLVTMALLLLAAKQLYDHVPPTEEEAEQHTAQTPDEKGPR